MSISIGLKFVPFIKKYTGRENDILSVINYGMIVNITQCIREFKLK